MAPQSQRKDLVAAASIHAIKSHGHADTPGVRRELDQFPDVIDV